MANTTNRFPVVRFILGLLLLLATGLGVAASDRLAPGSQAQQEEACVAPVPEIRRNHMNLLKHDRDLTVRKGDRDIKFSLSSCVACHAGKDSKGEAIPVNAPGQFCATCHQKLAVQPTCFQCHSAVPGKQQSAALNAKGRALLGRMRSLSASPEQIQELAQAHLGVLEK